MFKKYSSTKLIIFAVISILISLVFVVLYIFSIINDYVLMAGCVISFLGMSLVLNEITSRIVSKKFENKFSNPKEYILTSSLESSLEGVLCSDFNFGKTYLYINNNIAYKIVLVNNNDLYFNDNKQNSNVTDKRIEKCTSFFGFEIFSEVDEAIIKKLELYSFQSEKIFYTAFYKKDNLLVQPNYETPRDEHIESFKHILEKLRMVENESKS